MVSAKQKCVKSPCYFCVGPQVRVCCEDVSFSFVGWKTNFEPIRSSYLYDLVHHDYIFFIICFICLVYHFVVTKPLVRVKWWPLVLEKHRLYRKHDIICPLCLTFTLGDKFCFFFFFFGNYLSVILSFMLPLAKACCWNIVLLLFVVHFYPLILISATAFSIHLSFFFLLFFETGSHPSFYPQSS